MTISGAKLVWSLCFGGGGFSVRLVSGENENIVTKSRAKLVWSLCFGGGVSLLG